MNEHERNIRYTAIREIGCIACRLFGVPGIVPPQIHHLNFGDKHGGERRGDEFTIGLCPWHHVGQPHAGMLKAQSQTYSGPSWELRPSAFREQFGTGDELLAIQNALIAHWRSTFVTAAFAEGAAP